MTHFEFTNAKHPYNSRLRQIRATETLHFRGSPKKGEVGGWITSEKNLQDKAWITKDAVIIGEHVRISDNALISGSAVLYGNTVVKDNATVSGNAYLSGDTVVKDNAGVTGHVSILGEAEISGNAMVEGMRYLQIGNGCKISGWTDLRMDGYIRADSKISGGTLRGRAELTNADISDETHLLRIGPVGSENCTAQIYRTPTEIGHTVKIGCWNGVVDELAEEVEKRNDDDWLDVPEATKSFWRKQYYMVEMMARHSIAQWEAEKK